jgi:SAM-dependent methyltransferase
MPGISKRICSELWKTMTRPSRVLDLVNADKRHNLFVAVFEPGKWTDMESSGFRVRKYKDYEEYLRHQRSKRPLILATENHSRNFTEKLERRIRDKSRVKPGASVLCLGARDGSEVRAFCAAGCFAVGIDLQPTPQNAYVLSGDFQHLQWPDACIDVVFTNSLDHAIDIDRVLHEITRVLKAHGLLIIEAVRGSDENHPPGPWESFYWSKCQDLVDLIKARGFSLVGQGNFDVPWDGRHFVLEKQQLAIVQHFPNSSAA